MPSDDIPDINNQSWSLPINNPTISPINDDFPISYPDYNSYNQPPPPPSHYGLSQPFPSIHNQFSSPPPIHNQFSSPPHALRFLHDNLHSQSNSSSPIGSYTSSSTTDFYNNFPQSPPPPTTFQNSSRISKNPLKQTPTEDSSLLAERRRRRRESHNAVERRRRDNINEKIQELASLVPELLLLPDISSPPSTLTKDGRPNKGTILSKSVDYIRTLQNIIDSQNRREADLQDQVQDLQRQLGIPISDFTHTSAELLLAKIINPENSINDIVLSAPKPSDFVANEIPLDTNYQQTEDQFLS